jgi:hypothetical protein
LRLNGLGDQELPVGSVCVLSIADESASPCGSEAVWRGGEEDARLGEPCDFIAHGSESRATLGLIIHLDDGFNDAQLGAREFFELCDDRVEVRAMRDPGIGIDRAIFDQADDAAKVFGQGVT